MADMHSYIYKGRSVAFQKIGGGDPLLILHGWGSSSRAMMPLARKLSHIRTCYVFDLPGFGASDPPETAWNINKYANVMEQFIGDHFDTPVDLIVHSFGGRITLKLCARENSEQLVDKILITGGAGMKPKRDLSFYLRKYSAKMLKAPFYLLPQPAREKALEKLRQTSLWKSLGSQEYSRLSGVMRETFVKSVTEHLEHCLPAISHDVLLLWGRDDEATPLYQAKRMEKGMKNAVLVVIDNAGHYAFLDRPGHFASIAEAFFE